MKTGPHLKAGCERITQQVNLTGRCEHMPKALIIERENLPAVVQGWLKAVGLEESESVELVFTEREVLLRRPTDSKLREWTNSVTDEYDKAFKRIVGL